MSQLDRLIKRLRQRIEDLESLIEYQNDWFNNRWPVDAINFGRFYRIYEDNKADLAMYRYMLDLLEERNNAIN